MNKPFLILQLRPETAASDSEYTAILEKGALDSSQTLRIRLDQTSIPDDLSLDCYAGVIVGGGPGCVSDAPEEKSEIDRQIEDGVMGLMPEITRRDLPFLGCCYGIGILGHHLGARVDKSQHSEPVGTSDCVLTAAGKADPLLKGLPENFKAFVGHKEAMQELPVGAEHLVSSGTCPFQMIRFGNNVYATQFHPEADAKGFETRIRIYKDKGYFPPDDADDLIRFCQSVTVDAPERILANFVTRYSGT